MTVCGGISKNVALTGDRAGIQPSSKDKTKLLSSHSRHCFTVFRINGLKKKLRSEALDIMTNSPGTESTRLIMVIKSRAYNIRSK